MNKTLSLLLLFVVFALIVSPVYPDEIKLTGANKSVTADQKAFIEKYISIINSKNTDALERVIIHPACLEPLKKIPEFYNDTLKRRLNHSIPTEYTISIKDIANNDSLPFATSLIYPIRPSHLIMISYNKNETSSSSIMIQVINIQNQYFEVLPHPNKETMVKKKNKPSNK